MNIDNDGFITLEDSLSGVINLRSIDSDTIYYVCHHLSVDKVMLVANTMRGWEDTTMKVCSLNTMVAINEGNNNSSFWVTNDLMVRKVKGRRCRDSL
jgi:hypothetical protein